VNVSCLVLTTRTGQRLLLHLIRDIDVKKRLEAVTRRFLEQVSGLTGERMEALLHAPHPHLDISPREHDVLELLVEGLSTAQMSLRLGISVSTVRSHVNRLLRKLMVHDRTLAVLRAVRERLL
jgi:DNA-binding NarL/FixJ family response regulator